MPKETRDVLDWSGDEVVAWTKPKWYEKLAVLFILIPMGVIFAIPPTPLRIGLAMATVSSMVLPLDVHNRGCEDMDNH